MSSETIQAPQRRSWLKTFVREIGLPLLLAVVVIQFVIQAFRIPSGSMERSLLVGDWLLGLKFVYGSPIPFTEKRLPALADPKPGDVIIFHYPMDPDVPDRDPARFQFLSHTLLFGDYYWDRTPKPGQGHFVRYDSKDFIKRCVAVSGDTLTVRRMVLMRNGEEVPLAPNGQYDGGQGSEPPSVLAVRDSLGPLRIPSPGEVVALDKIGSEEFIRMYSLAIQENPGSNVQCSLWVERNGKPEPHWVMRQVPWDTGYPYFNLPQDLVANVYRLPSGPVFVDYQMSVLSRGISRYFRFGDISGSQRSIGHDPLFPRFGVALDQAIKLQRAMDTSRDVIRLRKAISIDGKLDTNYTVRQQVLFMMGDNRDESLDSRFWGYLSRRNVKAKALVIYFSLDNEASEGRESPVSFNPFSWLKVPFYTRWSRIGRLVHD